MEKVFVPELNAGQLILEVQRIVGDRCKVIGINKYCGEIFKTKELESAIEEGTYERSIS